jgi:hypothetical protein
VAGVATPLSLRLAIVVATVETVLAWVYVGFLGYASGSIAGGWRVTGFFLLFAVAFTGLTWALVARRRWVRAPLIVLQFLLAAFGLGFVNAGWAGFGVPLIVLAVSCVGLLLAPATREALGAR